jgi:hypothetical protein
MKQSAEKAGSGRGATRSDARKSPGIFPIVMIGVVIVGAAIAFKFLRHTSPNAELSTDTDAAITQPVEQPVARPIVPHGDTASTPVATPGSAPAVGRSAAPAAPSAPEAPVDAHQLLSSLTALDGKQPISAEDAQRWKESLQKLIRQGASSVPGIEEFLAQNQDVNYAGVSGAGDLGYSSLRSALLDALAQIGGTDATAAMLQIMQTSVFPTDIATLAKTLDASAPGQYQQDILNAVRQQLSLANMDQLNGANVGPLFQVLATEAANGAPISGDLAQYASKWPYYSAIALTTLPDNAGVPALIQMAQGTIGSSQAAGAQALAELSLQNPDALNALLDMAKNGQLPDAILAQMGPFLAGRDYELGPPTAGAAGGNQTYHMANGNQDFSSYDTANTMTPAQVNQHLGLIDQFLQAIPPTDSAAQDALQLQKNILTGKLGN